MAQIGIFHPDLMKKGGAESVCVHVINALAESNDVTLVTATDTDFRELSTHYGVDINDVSVERVEDRDSLASRLINSTRKNTWLLEKSLFSSYVGTREYGFDLSISIDNELCLNQQSIQYIHFPDFYRPYIEQHPTPRKIKNKIYDRVCRSIAKIDKETMHNQFIVANSDWTADVVEETYNTRPDILYPPVDCSDFTETRWSEREDGFVSIGRIDPSKNTLRLIKIVSELREAGHDVHLHLVGSMGNEYSKRVTRLAKGRDHIHIEGELRRDELIEMIQAHRYGLHGKPNEHFGISVAELVAGGTIPFLPNSGGQREIVNHESAILYDTKPEAVRKIDDVLSNSSLQNRIRRSLPCIERKFGVERFTREINELVNRALDDRA